MYYYRKDTIHFKDEGERQQRRNKFHASPNQRNILSRVDLKQHERVSRSTDSLPTLRHERVSRSTDSLPTLRYVKQNTSPLPTNENKASKIYQSLTAESIMPKSMQSLPNSEEEEFIREELASLKFYIKRIVLGAWKPFKDAPPRIRYVCIVLFILVQLMLSFVIWSLMASLMLIMNLIYLILAIPATYIILDEWMQANKQKKDQQRKRQ